MYVGNGSDEDKEWTKLWSLLSCLKYVRGELINFCNAKNEEHAS
jgi:hypothetical protein